MTTSVTLPFTINGVTFNDGDYINLFTPQAQIVNGPPTIGTNYAMNDPSSLGNLYINSGKYALSINAPGQKTQSYTTYAVNNAHTDYSSYNIALRGNPQVSSQNLGDTTMISDATLAPTMCLYQQRQKLTYVGPYPDRGQVTPESYDRQNLVANISNNNEYRLCLEFHKDNYIALRSVNGLYLHMMNTYDLNSTYRSVANKEPANIVATFTNKPSSYFTAQWKVFVGANNSVQLQNRGSGTFLALGAGQQSWSNIQYYTAGFGEFNYITKTAATTYDNTYQNAMKGEWWELIMQPYWRLIGNNPTNGTAFTIFKGTQSCDPVNNPTNSLCMSSLNNNQDPTSAISNGLQNFCAIGDLPTTTNCQGWIVNQKSNVSALINNYCQANPNDLSLCACVNTWPFRGLMDYISFSTNPVGLIPKCNVTECARNTDSCWHPTNEPSCDQQVCVQGLAIKSVVSSQINVNQNCNFAGDNTVPDTTPETDPDPTVTNFLTEFLKYVQNLSSSQLYFALVVFISVLVVLFLLRLPKSISSITAAGLAGSAVYFKLDSKLGID